MISGRLIDPPDEFAPKSELQAFLDQYEADPDPDVKRMVAEVRGYLEDKDKPMSQRRPINQAAQMRQRKR
jgi:hypothetical protein